jgi:hypothetical protein
VLDADRRTPVRAVLLQAAITIALILLGDGFRALVRITVVALWAFYFLTVRRAISQRCVLLVEYRVEVLAVVILRVREPDLPRYVFRLRMLFLAR